MNLRGLASDSGLYIAGNILRRGVSIITMPVFTRYLSPSGYGVLALVGTVQSLLEPLYSLGMQGSATRLYYEAPDEAGRRRFFGTLLLVLLSRAVPITVLLLALGPWVWSLVVPDIPFTPYVTLTIATSLVGIVGILPRVLFRVESQVPRFFRLSLAQTLLVTGLSVALVVGAGWGPLGPIMATLLAEVAFSAVYARHLWPHLALVLDRPTARRALRFGLPTVVVPVGAWAIRTSDRLILQHFTSLTVVGLYAVAGGVGKIAFDVVGNAVNWAVVPFVYATLKREPEHRARPVLARLATYNVAILVGLALVTILYARELIHLFAAATFAEAASVVPLLACASLVQVLTYIPSRGIGVREKTFYFPIIVGVGAAVSLALNFTLIPQFGMHGAAIATLAGQASCLALTLPISQRLYPIPYEWGRLGRLALATGAIAAAVSLLPDSSPILYQLVKLVIVMSFPALLLLLGFFVDDEVRLARRRLAGAGRSVTAAAGTHRRLMSRAGTLLVALATGVFLVQFAAGEARRRSGLTARDRWRIAMLAATAADAPFPRVWRRLMTRARSGLRAGRGNAPDGGERAPAKEAM